PSTPSGEPWSIEDTRNTLRAAGGGGMADVLGVALEKTAAAGSRAWMVTAGNNPKVRAFLGKGHAPVQILHGPVGAVDDAAGQRLGQAYQRAAETGGGYNYQQVLDRLFYLTQPELNALADNLFAAGYLQPDANWDWTRSYSSQALVTPDQLLTPVTNWFGHTTMAKPGTTMSDILNQRIAANKAEQDRQKAKAEELRTESLRYLTITADEIARQTVGHSLGAAFNYNVVAPLANKAARGFDISSGDAQGETVLAIDKDEKLRGERESYQMGQ